MPEFFAIVAIALISLVASFAVAMGSAVVGRLQLAIAMGAIAVTWPLHQPVHEGAILLTLSPTHGVTVSDLVAGLPACASLFALAAIVRGRLRMTSIVMSPPLDVSTDG